MTAWRPEDRAARSISRFNSLRSSGWTRRLRSSVDSRAAKTFSARTDRWILPPLRMSGPKAPTNRRRKPTDRSTTRFPISSPEMSNPPHRTKSEATSDFPVPTPPVTPMMGSLFLELRGWAISTKEFCRMSVSGRVAHHWPRPPALPTLGQGSARMGISAASSFIMSSVSDMLYPF